MDKRKNINPFLDSKNNPWISIEIKLSIWTKIDCIIDTGFSGSIALPSYYSNLYKKSTPTSIETYEFANGEKEILSIFRTEVKYLNKKILTNFFFLNAKTPLIGIDFIKNYNLKIDFKNGTISLD